MSFAFPFGLLIPFHIGDRSSASYSVETSSAGHAAKPVQRILARIREAFKFRVQLESSSGNDLHSATLELKLMSGGRVPSFVRADLTPSVNKTSPRAIDFAGTPLSSNVGVLDIGVFVRGTGECVGRLILEVVEQKRT